MSVNDFADDVEEIAFRAVIGAGSVHFCRWHDDILLTDGNHDADHLAYAMAINSLKRSDQMFLSEEVLDSVKRLIEMAASECPRCEKLRDD